MTGFPKARRKQTSAEPEGSPRKTTFDADWGSHSLFPASMETQPGNEVSTLVPCLWLADHGLVLSQSKHHGVGEAEVPLAG